MRTSESNISVDADDHLHMLAEVISALREAQCVFLNSGSVYNLAALLATKLSCLVARSAPTCYSQYFVPNGFQAREAFGCVAAAAGGNWVRSVGMGSRKSFFCSFPPDVVWFICLVLDLEWVIGMFTVWTGTLCETKCWDSCLVQDNGLSLH